MGDPNGIGAEVLIRALQFLHPFQKWEALIFGDAEILTKMNEALGLLFHLRKFRKTTACIQTDPLILFVFR